MEFLSAKEAKRKAENFSHSEIHKILESILLLVKCASEHGKFSITLVKNSYKDFFTLQNKLYNSLKDLGYQVYDYPSQNIRVESSFEVSWK